MLFIFNAHCDVDTTDYLYDDEGCPSFVKVYLNEEIENDFYEDEEFLTANKVILSTFRMLMQRDRKGSYLAIPLQKKGKDKDKDKDEEDYWTCPHCGRKNRATDNNCKTWGCP